MEVAFVGYTQTRYGGDLGGRTGAHAKCDAEFSGSHFCTHWEIDQADAPAPATPSWLDRGREDQDSRYFRPSYSVQDVYSCAGWTTSSPSHTVQGGSVARGYVFNPLGDVDWTFVSNVDGGCGVQRPLSCCMGGTAIRFRGYTSPRTGELGGRTGANAICHASFAGSHFCTDWEMDQAAVATPIPASGLWVDGGNSNPSTRNFRPQYTTRDVYTCGGWTAGTATAKPDGSAVARGHVFTPLGGLTWSLLSNTDGGCQNPRPLACCDGYPPR
jgi:hypothetical protein